MSNDAVQTIRQPTDFAFTQENGVRVEKILGKYPADRKPSAVLPLLDLAQRQAGGWLPRAAMDHVAGILSMAPIRVYEVATFYTMFNLQPTGLYLIQVCRTTPCWLRGSDDLTEVCKRKLGIGLKETTEDGAFTLVEVECLGACVNAPVIQINDDYYEDLDPILLGKILVDLAEGKNPQHGSQVGRQGSAPQGIKTSEHGAGE